MERKKDLIEEMLLEGLTKEAEAIDEELKDSQMEPLSEEKKEQLKRKLMEQIDNYEKERLYDQLSEEDRKALELGKELLQKEKVVRRKKKPKLWYVLAAVLVLVLALGITSVGGAQRIVEMMRVAVGDREMVRVDTEENYVIINENEEAVYEQLREVFGVDAVKIVHRPEGMNFAFSGIDEELQTAVLGYEYQGEVLHYYICTHHTENSWGIDVEDKITDEYVIEHENKGPIDVVEYETDEKKVKSYSASFSYKGLEYFMIGVMKRDEFEFLLKNLNFF